MYIAKDLLDTLIRARDSESGVVLTNKQLFDHVSLRPFSAQQLKL